MGVKITRRSRTTWAKTFTNIHHYKGEEIALRTWIRQTSPLHWSTGTNRESHKARFYSRFSTTPRLKCMVDHQAHRPTWSRLSICNRWAKITNSHHLHHISSMTSTLLTSPLTMSMIWTPGRILWRRFSTSRIISNYCSSINNSSNNTNRRKASKTLRIWPESPTAILKANTTSMRTKKARTSREITRFVAVKQKKKTDDEN